MHEVATSADEVPIHYDVDGHGTPTLVFVHGWCCDRSYWKKQVEHLASQYSVVAIDLAGHGESGTDRSAWTIPAFSRDVVAVIEQLDISQVVLVGHAYSGVVVVEAARQIAGRVLGIGRAHRGIRDGDDKGCAAA